MILKQKNAALVGPSVGFPLHLGSFVKMCWTPGWACCFPFSPSEQRPKFTHFWFGLTMTLVKPGGRTTDQNGQWESFLGVYLKMNRLGCLLQGGTPKMVGFLLSSRENKKKHQPQKRRAVDHRRPQPAPLRRPAGARRTARVPSPPPPQGQGSRGSLGVPAERRRLGKPRGCGVCLV